uniref:B30.2/SPRY domain-containing protein n=1 Tax=Seriola lalandi dorsalis TaxID=1841481 RepID=A0A3B4XC41_SERLL
MNEFWNNSLSTTIYISEAKLQKQLLVPVDQVHHCGSWRITCSNINTFLFYIVFYWFNHYPVTQCYQYLDFTALYYYYGVYITVYILDTYLTLYTFNYYFVCRMNYYSFLYLHIIHTSHTPTKDWTEVRVRPPSYEGTVVRAVAQLEETLSEEMKKLIEAELKRVQQYAEDVTLDPDTAHPKLILSDDGKQVHHSDVRKNLPDNPKRFSYCVIVLGKQSFSSGRFYFEVQVKGKTDWILGVARESINRKGEITLRPQNGYWTIWLRNGNDYKALDDPRVRLSLKSQPEKVGVFVDHEEGLVSFYDVAAAALIYSFTGLNDGGKSSAPLIISGSSGFLGVETYTGTTQIINFNPPFPNSSLGPRPPPHTHLPPPLPHSSNSSQNLRPKHYTHYF